MVGRDQELALLLERWTQAKAGEGQAVLLVGEAGVGKSRISRALLDALSPEPHTRIRYQCSPYHSDSGALAGDPAARPRRQLQRRRAAGSPDRQGGSPARQRRTRDGRSAVLRRPARPRRQRPLRQAGAEPAGETGPHAGGVDPAAGRAQRPTTAVAADRGHPLDRPDHPRAGRALARRHGGGTGADAAHQPAGQPAGAGRAIRTSPGSASTGSAAPVPRQSSPGSAAATCHRRPSTPSSPAPTACRSTSRS